MKWLIAFLVFSLLVLFHEFGHFVVALLSGVEVEEFSLGFGPRLLSVKKGETRYSIKLLLFGGSCRMKGMYAVPEEDEDGKERAPEEGSFPAASLGKRAAIILAGPVFNFILAFICSVAVISVIGYDPAYIVYVGEDSSAAKAGLQTGDLVTNFNGDPVAIGRDISTWEMLHDYSADKEIRIRYLRDGEEGEAVFYPDVTHRYMLGMTYTPGEESAEIQAVHSGSPLEEAGVRTGDVIKSINGTEIHNAQELNDYFAANPLDGTEITLVIGRGEKTYETKVSPAERDDIRVGFAYNIGRTKTDPLGVLRYSFTEVRYWITTTVRALGGMFTGRFTVNDLSGPVGIVDIVGTTYEESKEDGPLMVFMNMLNLIILLSANLGVMNLLPIPALDGGRLLFLLIEGIRGKPVSQNAEIAIQSAAALLLMALMVYVMYHDLVMMFT